MKVSGAGECSAGAGISGGYRHDGGADRTGGLSGGAPLMVLDVALG